MGKRKERREQADLVDLGGDDHAWWANARVTQGFRAARPEDVVEDARPEGAREREHERSSDGSLFDAPPPQQPTMDQPWPPRPPVRREADLDQHYRTLGVDARATWEEVVVAYRRHARRWHPDRLAEADPAEQSEAQRRMSELNIAYESLRKRLQPRRRGIFTG